MQGGGLTALTERDGLGHTTMRLGGSHDYKSCGINERVFKGIRNLPVTALISATYFRMATLFATRGKRWNSMLQTQQVYSNVCMKYIQQESAKGNTHRVTEFDRHDHTFNVKETIDHNQGLPRQQYRVSIQDRWCDCGQFQAYRMPCSHVIAECSHTHFDALSLV